MTLLLRVAIAGVDTELALVPEVPPHARCWRPIHREQFPPDRHGRLQTEVGPLNISALGRGRPPRLGGRQWLRGRTAGHHGGLASFGAQGHRVAALCRRRLMADSSRVLAPDDRAADLAAETEPS